MRLPPRGWYVAGALLAAAVACASVEPKPPPADPSPQPRTDAGVGETSTPTPSAATVEPIPSCGYPASATSFTLPSITGLPPGSFGSLGGEVSCFDGKPFRYALRDMDGDRQPDLVVESACGDATIGLDAWDVYANGGAGFAATAKRFALPQPRLDPTCAKWELADVNGDLAPDLVVTSLCTDNSVGTTRWIVYVNGPAGFGAPAPFALPVQPGAPMGAFASVGPGVADCTKDRPAYAFFDVDGDKKADLVITRACDNVQVGTTAWRVYLGSGAGVAASPISFPLPSAPSVPLGTYASATGGGPGCNAHPAGPHYSVVDFDGDLKPDLVLTENCTDPSVGLARWSVYRNSGSGFAAVAATVPLPVLAGASSLHAFDGLTATELCHGVQQSPSYVTVDVDGDLRPELLVTRTCSEITTGVAEWLLYKNHDGGLATVGASLSLPAALGATVTAPLALGGDAGCSASPPRPEFVAMPLARSKLDLVVTRACADATVGTSRWLLFEPACP
jgi:hypothetical protein